MPVGVNLMRVRNGTATAADWIDPDDIDVNRRLAKTISGHRAVDGLHNLYTCKSISKTQYAAGARYWRSYELGEIGCSGSAIARLGQALSGSSDAGPSELRLAALERYQHAKLALGRVADIVDAVVCVGTSLRAYSLAWRLNQTAALGRLSAGSTSWSIISSALMALAKRR